MWKVASNSLDVDIINGNIHSPLYEKEVFESKFKVNQCDTNKETKINAREYHHYYVTYAIGSFV